jgi:hypothetical protein
MLIIHSIEGRSAQALVAHRNGLGTTMPKDCGSLAKVVGEQFFEVDAYLLNRRTSPRLRAK